MSGEEVRGMHQTFSELRAKEVIRLCDAECIGYVSDLVLDLSCGCTCGRITALCVVPAGGVTALFSRTRITVPWERVRCIGRQTILVDIVPGDCCGEEGSERMQKNASRRNCK